MDTEALAVLVNASSAGSLSAAARRMGISPIVAARRLASLERDIGVRLMHRTTRSISLTSEGKAFAPYAEKILESEAAALATLKPGNAGATGLLRATVPASLGRRIIIPMLPQLLADNPQLKVELLCTDRVVDIVAEGLDLAVRISDLKQSSLIVRRIGRLKRVVCASPIYLARRGHPKTIEELSHHDCLTLLDMTHWVFLKDGETRRIRVNGPLSCSSIDGLYDACVQGMGISMHASWTVEEDVQTGKLVQLDLDAVPYAPQISALYPSSQMVAPKIRVFVKALINALPLAH